LFPYNRLDTLIYHTKFGTLTHHGKLNKVSTKEVEN